LRSCLLMQVGELCCSAGSRQEALIGQVALKQSKTDSRRSTLWSNDQSPPALRPCERWGVMLIAAPQAPAQRCGQARRRPTIWRAALKPRQALFGSTSRNRIWGAEFSHCSRPTPGRYPKLTALRSTPEVGGRSFGSELSSLPIIIRPDIGGAAGFPCRLPRQRFNVATVRPVSIFFT
jgi:hypothetical protein